MKGKCEKISLDIVESTGAIIVWTFFVFLLFKRGFQENFSPVQLGVVSFLFSGVMAFTNAILPHYIRPGKEKRYILTALVLEVLACVLLFKTDSFYILLILIILEAVCYSVITESKKALMEYKNYHGNSEFIFKLFRMLGPFLGGIAIWLLPGTFNIVYIGFIGVVGFIFTLSVNNKDDMRRKEEISDLVYIESKKYSTNKLYIHIFILLVALITLCIQVIDAQLVTVFHNVVRVNSIIIGSCIGCSGIGVFLISIFLERHITRAEYFFLSVLLMGLVLIIAGVYISSSDKVEVAPLILMFFFGGIFWQTVMTFLENVIKSFLDTKLKNYYFQVVGVLLIFTYSVGALSSGLWVKIFTIEKVYLGLGMILFTASLCLFLYAKLKLGGKDEKTTTS